MPVQAQEEGTVASSSCACTKKSSVQAQGNRILDETDEDFFAKILSTLSRARNSSATGHW